MALGDRKRKKSQWVNNHTYYPPFSKAEEPVPKKRRGMLTNTKTVTKDSKKKTIVRLGERNHKKAVRHTDDGRLITQESSGKITNNTILRPKKEEPYDFFREYNADSSLPQGFDNINIVVHTGKLLAFINLALLGHHKHSGTCKGSLKYDNDNVEQYGLAWKLGLKCPLCNYQTKKQKLYTEIQRPGKGKKRACMNVGLQIGLSRQRVGYVGITDILAAANIAPPSRFSMQQNANYISKLIVDINQRDMAGRLQQLRDLMRSLGMDEGLLLLADGRYGSRLGNKRTPYQASNDAVFTVCEGNTLDKSLVHLGYYQRKCKCPHGREGIHLPHCQANRPWFSSIGKEGLMLKDGVQSIREQGGQVSAVCLDGDSNATCMAKELNLFIQHCLQHITRNNTKFAKNLVFSEDMFLLGRLAEDKKIHQDRFTLDLNIRCRAELYMQAQHNPGDIDSINSNGENVQEAIILCYRGNHSMCDKYSMVCRPEHRWPRPYIVKDVTRRENSNDTIIFPKEPEDTDLLREVISKFFAIENLETTYQGITTNKCESAHSVMERCMPHGLTFLRNGKGRAHSAGHMVNNGQAISLVKICQEAGCPIAANSRVLQRLQERHKWAEADKARQSSLEYKASRAHYRTMEYNVHAAQRQEEKCYEKGKFLAQDREQKHDWYQAGLRKAYHNTQYEHTYCEKEAPSTSGN